MAKMKKSDREAYGKLKKLTPAMKHQIDWLVGRVHVGTPDEEVEADMRKRLKPIAGVNDALIEQAVKYALQAHHKNQGLYTDVMSGFTARSRRNPSAPRRRMRPYGNIHASKRMMYPYGNPAPTATMKALAGRRRGHDVGQIYIADLASYNAGKLCGEWITPDSDPIVLGEQIQEVLSKCGGEEWAIHDYDGFPNLGEHPSIEELAGVAEALEEHGDVMRALLHDDPKYWGRDIDDAKRHIEDNFAGVFKDARREFILNLIDDGVVGADQMKQYFDYEAFGRDIRMDLDEEGEDSWAADMSDEELGEHYADDMGHDLGKQTIETYFDADSMYEALENGGEINVVTYGGKDYVFWNR